MEEWTGIDNRQPLNPEFVELHKSRWEPPQRFENILNQDDIDFLLDLEENGNDVQIVKAGQYERRISKDRSKAYEYLKDRINSMLTFPHKFTNEFGTGNFFRTTSPYTLHADTGINPNDKLYRIVVFPLRIKTNGQEYLPQYNQLTIFNQQWYGQACLFMAGDPERVKSMSAKYIKPVSEYTHLHRRATEPFPQERFDELYTHLKYSHFEGLSERVTIPWVPGDGLTFDRCDVHTATNFFKANVVEKTAVTFFLEYAE